MDKIKEIDNDDFYYEKDYVKIKFNSEFSPSLIQNSLFLAI